MRIEQNSKPRFNRRLTPETVATIRDLQWQGTPVSLLSERFKLSQSMIRSLINRKLYKDVP